MSARGNTSGFSTSQSVKHMHGKKTTAPSTGDGSIETGGLRANSSVCANEGTFSAALRMPDPTSAIKLIRNRGH